MKTFDRIQEFKIVQKSLKSDRTPFSLFFVECGEGWGDIIYNLCKELEALQPNLIIFQIKEKFGGLRFYTQGHTKQSDQLIRKAEEEAWHTCEVCGKPGSNFSDKGWLKVRCEECKKDGKRLKEKFPDCKIIQTLVELEKDLDDYLDREIFR
jgi:hypothetical protein